MKRTAILAMLAFATAAFAATVEGNLIEQQRANSTQQLCTYTVVVDGARVKVSRLADFCTSTISVPVTEAKEAKTRG